MGLKEAALDSPTFRAEITHFSEQLELIEKWLEAYIRSIAKLSHEIGTFESALNGFLSQTVPPSYVSEAVVDHDYTLLAIKRYGEGAKEFWSASISGLKRMEANMVDPIKVFFQNELRPFKDVRRSLEQTQKQFDSLQSRYSGLARTREASSLREDAFILHETRKAYLKASMDFSTAAPQLRMALDKMLVRVFSDQGRDTRGPRQRAHNSLERWGNDIERVRGWSREMEKGEMAFRRELLDARKQIEESAELTFRPSRELEDYTSSPIAIPASRGPSTTNLQTPSGKSKSTRSEKQGWLNLRTISGKPSRTIWLRRWFYVKNGIFGWLVQGSRSGGVEESERIGVLLCNVKPTNLDDRRNLFELKTKDTTLVLQAESQSEINDWLAAFDVAKQKALEDPASTESPGLEPRAQDPAFAISPPSAPEFAASAIDSGMPQYSEEASVLAGMDRSSTLPLPGLDLSASRNSFDVSGHRRSFAERDSDPPKDPASRIIQKLDLHRKPAGDIKGPASAGLSGGGIASLIAASHGSMPVGPGASTLPPPETPRKSSAPNYPMRDLPTSSLAPNTLINPPAPTNLSSAAVIVNGERGIGIGRTDSSGGMPSGIMANVWGSMNWGHLNRLSELKGLQERSISLKLSNPSSPMIRPSNLSQSHQSGSPPMSRALSEVDESSPNLSNVDKTPIASAASSPSHHKTVSLDANDKSAIAPPEYPNYYPLQLKIQDAQFRLLFPNVRRDERLVLVFKATWNPNGQQDFPGRAYVTMKDIYFYSNTCGMTLLSSIRLDAISEFTAARGRESDFVFCHLKDEEGYSRIIIKTFLEPLNLLKRRLNYLIRNRTAPEAGIEEVLKSLIKMEQEDPESSSSMDGWENVSISTPADGDSTPKRNPSYRDPRNLRANLLVDRGLYKDGPLQVDGVGDSKTFKLPKQPIVYAPSGMDRLAVEKEFDISPKALFHVMFGDKSAVWQLLYHERQAQHIRQGPWTQTDHGHLRRDFDYQLDYLDVLRRVRQARVEDHQLVEVANEHLLYVVSDRKSPWRHPFPNSFLLLTKIVITHLAKSKCKLGLYIKAEWIKPPPYVVKGLITEAALKDLELDALDLTDLISEQVRNFASAHGRTKKAIQIFGQVGVQTQTSEFAGSEAPLKAQLRRSRKHHTLTALAFESFASMSESVITSAGQIILRFVGWIWKTISANMIILGVLAISVVLNMAFSSTGVSDWWSERKARKFMTPFGLGPDLTMSKSIYVRDLEESTALSPGDPKETSSQCRDAFNAIMNLPDASPPSPSNVLSVARSQAITTRRLQRTRQHLGIKRHDLLVAMRVVNSIEREMIQAEWENWLMDEGAKCERLGHLIRRNNDTELSSSSPSGLDRAEEIKTWHQEYCGSCSQEQALLGI